MRQLSPPPAIVTSASTVPYSSLTSLIRPFASRSSSDPDAVRSADTSIAGQDGSIAAQRDAGCFGASLEAQIVERIEQSRLDCGGKRLGQPLPHRQVFERSIEGPGAAIARPAGQRERPGEIEIDGIRAERRERARDLERQVRRVEIEALDHQSVAARHRLENGGADADRLAAGDDDRRTANGGAPHRQVDRQIDLGQLEGTSSRSPPSRSAVARPLAASSSTTS